MKRAMGYILIATALFTGYQSCRKPFAAQLTSTATGFLSVDGPVISGDTTFITLNRSTALNDTTQKKAELKAVISVEDDQNKLYPLTEQGKGIYYLPTTNFDVARKYRLDIKTSNGKVYQSDFVPMKITGPIDSIYYHVNGFTNVQFFLDAHDPTNNTRYYRWDYTEVWEYVAYYEADYQYINGQIIAINSIQPPPSSGYYCYQHGYSNQIFVGSSANLSHDVITKQLLSSLADTSEKLAHIYAMVVHQYALTEDGLNYYQNLKLNTEQLGSIFDSQPSFVTGNIHCISNPTEQVLGFVSVSTVSNKVISFYYNQLGQFILPVAERTVNSNNQFYFGQPDSSKCVPIELLFNPASTYAVRTQAALGPGIFLIYGQDQVLGQGWIGYLYAPKNCVDCSYKGGTKTKPSYFPPPY